MSRSLNIKVSKILSRLADSKELIGENPFKIIAIRKASRTVKNLTDSLELVADYQKIPGIGISISKKISEIILTGRLKEMDELDEKIPKSFWDFSSIRGLGIGSMKKLFKAKIFNYEKLKNIIFQEDLDFFSKTQNENIRRGIKFHEKYRGKFLLYEGSRIFSEIKKQNPDFQFKKTGSLARCDEVLNSIEVICVCEEEAKIEKILKIFNGKIEKDVIKGFFEKRNLDIFLCKKSNFGTRSLETSSLKVHLDDIKLFESDSEEKIYKMNGYDYIPPELRIWKASEFRTGVPNLLTIDEIDSDMHMHTSYSDGINSIEEMVEASSKKNYKRIAITDHSKSASYAGGLKEEKLLSQCSYIKNKKWDIDVFSGSECDILNDGSLDYDDEILKKLDWVVGSIHQNLEGDQTGRILKAIENENMDVLGHATGRRLLIREGYYVDWSKVLSKLSQTNIALEINANPERLDVNATVAREASSLGIKLSLNTDAHSINHLDFMKMAVNQARRAGLDKSSLLNL